MGRLAIVWLFGAGVLGAPPAKAEWNRFQFARTEMAVPVKIVLYATDTATANAAQAAAFDRIRQLNGILSDYDLNSELRRLCDTAGEGKNVPVSDDLWKVLSYAQILSEKSNGAFDVTVGPIVRLWRRARRQEVLPRPERISEALILVGYRFIHLDPKSHSVRLEKAGMRLDLGGIAKGYAIDEALAVLRKHGVTRTLVDAGGDIGIGDPPPAEATGKSSLPGPESCESAASPVSPVPPSGWRIGVAALEPDKPPSRYLRLSRRAIATSGDAWQYVVIDGKRYSHLVDPHTGVGLTDHSTVTVVAPDAMTADGLASAVSVLGPEKGLRLIDSMPGTAAFIVRAPEGRVQTYESRRWKELPLVPPADK